MDQLHEMLPLGNIIPQLTSDIQSFPKLLGASDVRIIIDIVSTILNHGGLSSSVTMESLYRFTRIECIFVCTSVLQEKKIYVSHTSHPHVRVVDAVAASCCIPGVFRPVKINGEYMVDGNLLESIPIPFTMATTLYFVVGNPYNDSSLNMYGYIRSLMNIVTRYNAQVSCLPLQRCIVLSHSSAVFDPFINKHDTNNIRFNGFIQTLSFLHFGNSKTLVSILHYCIEAYIRWSICIDITTNCLEEMPRLFES